MSETITRRSPVLDRLPSEPIDVITSQGMAFAVVVEAYEIEAAAKQKVALCDLSYHAKWGLKGSGAAAWLADAGVNVPEGNYATGPLNSDDSAAGELGEDGGLIIRLPGEEFFLESGVKGEFLAQLRERDLSAGDVFPVEHQEATLLLVGKEARGVLAQTCGIDFAKADVGRAIMTRVAGVNCTILPQQFTDGIAYRMWVDYSYAAYLWDTLLEIVTELGGRAIGAGILRADLS